MSTLDEFYEGGPKTWDEAFPPICLRSHWDPTALSKHILPTTGPVNLPLDPRQSTKICTSYYTTSESGPMSREFEEAEPSPTIPSALLGGSYQSPAVTYTNVLPPGGAASLGFPYKEFNPLVESDLQLLKMPLTRCSERKYLPKPIPEMTNTVPGANSDILSPFATVVSKEAGCRAADDEAAWNRSARLFFNPTKYDRTTMVPSGLHKAESNNSLRC